MRASKQLANGLTMERHAIKHELQKIDTGTELLASAILHKKEHKVAVLPSTEEKRIVKGVGTNLEPGTSKTGQSMIEAQ